MSPVRYDLGFYIILYRMPHIKFQYPQNVMSDETRLVQLDRHYFTSCMFQYIKTNKLP
jgi:hypothetical protein